MAAILNTVNVATSAEMNQAMSQYMSQGFVVTSQTAEVTTLNKTPSIVWSFKEICLAILLTFLCIVPGLIYIRNAYKRHGVIENVVIRVDPAAAALEASSAGTSDGVGLKLSEDRRFWWNESEWVDCAVTVPPGAQYSEDQRSWWDGQTWRSVPPGGSTATTSPE